jgi:uncharacterized membrane protein YeiH
MEVFFRNIYVPATTAAAAAVVVAYWTLIEIEVHIFCVFSVLFTSFRISNHKIQKPEPVS